MIHFKDGQSIAIINGILKTAGNDFTQEIGFMYRHNETNIAWFMEVKEARQLIQEIQNIIDGKRMDDEQKI